MVRKLRTTRFDAESESQQAIMRSRIGQEVPLSHYYWKGQKPILVGIDGDVCILRYPNGATMRDVPLTDLVDDSGYWKSG